MCACGEAWKLESRDVYCNWRCHLMKLQISLCETALAKLAGFVVDFLCSLGFFSDKAGLVLAIDHRSTRKFLLQSSTG